MTNNLLKAALTAAALSAVAMLGACSTNDMPGMGHGTASANPSSADNSAPTAEFNDADVMFAQKMIPHHDQAVAMSDMILAKSSVKPDVQALANQIKAAQQPEIDTMNAWLKTWGQDFSPDTGGGHHGSDDGMATTEEMRQLDEADGATGQKLYLTMMIKHHEGAITMAKTEIDAGKNPAVIQMANNIVTTQQREIATMNSLLSGS
jgi:uncharacterized protein (DUF305 family)